MNLHQIDLVNRNSLEKPYQHFTVDVAESQYILGAIESAGLKLPVGCRIGACITCAARLIQGEVDQPRAIALKPAQAKKGYVLLCVALPRSACQFEVGIECQTDLFYNPFRGS